MGSDVCCGGHLSSNTLPNQGCSGHCQVSLAAMTLLLNSLKSAPKWLLVNGIQLLIVRRLNQSDAVAALALGFLSGLQTAKGKYSRAI